MEERGVEQPAGRVELGCEGRTAAILALTEGVLKRSPGDGEIRRRSASGEVCVAALVQGQRSGFLITTPTQVSCKQHSRASRIQRQQKSVLLPLELRLENAWRHGKIG